ncbi:MULTISPECIES: TMEM175 family protein [Micromonospora]|uniref:DUF1211 domain-containing protein n=1 Tax=Micromonospora sicca TaxID=2202420 RepID=A0A317DJJ4_9ACTN|nr:MULTISPECIES: TMEM175 family protein [unclassified Micromonospora]MBM0228076.1 DUF1211 domain-containing protein [Micromonospora sp. ATA51]PWR14818.1 hypothetical protein DKT69_14440 [Micromonospora sp. 4G51]
MSASGEAAGTPPVSDIGRLTGFSDGVFAIVITLLVIELRVPAHRPGELLAGLVEEAPAYVAFLLSFGYVGVIWLNHHMLLRLVRGTTLGLNWINLWLLLGVVVIPFPTAVLAAAFAHDGNDHDRRVAVLLYALAAAAMSAPLARLLQLPAPASGAAGGGNLRGARRRPAGPPGHRDGALPAQRRAGLVRQPGARSDRHRGHDRLSRADQRGRPPGSAAPPLTAGGPVPPALGDRAGGRCGAVPGGRARTLGLHERPVHDAAPRRGQLRLAPA